ncbi:anti-phage dCTP deaminase [Adhaeribacter soli]|uniref:Deoxycytidylate deaminase n=1 Tax=Adhaeribacter soli TaxID=2607655 RepID=A0A5N1J6H2_9BACT|nr:anti-phage dCTP deaminase [Adhaeribacter soli]KAA9345552.1 deoxycytidylate deaminase [Adhaeribacter soli]
MGAAEKLSGNFIFNKSEESNTKEKIEKTFSEELVIGICAPIGTNKDGFINSLIERLKEYHYECEIIKLSQFIRDFKDKVSIDTESLSKGRTSNFRDKMELILTGDELRKTINTSILAELAIFNIHSKRYPDGDFNIKSDFDLNEIDQSIYESKRKCYIIDSIKNKEELALFRTVYRELFYFFSLFTPLGEREEALRKCDLSPSEIDELIKVDAGSGFEHGQDVRNVFVKGDFFFRISENSNFNLIERIKRCLHLIFDTEVVTPTTHETAMYHAKSAAKNSACLSRQVGAAVTDKLGHVLGVGWNDVPKFGGNLYASPNNDFNEKSNLPDNRCINLTYDSNNKLTVGDGACFNDIEKNLLSEELTDELVRIGIINPSNKEQAYTLIRNSKVKGLIEYSRSVHAEMHAIILSSQMSGDKMKSGKLYCTTYPCHNCARHIVVSGITEVYYIEPYVKSLCMKLHSDSITETETEDGKVRILMFDGVSPNRYIKFFSIHNPRKGLDGKAIRNKELTIAKPKTQLSLRDIPSLESQAVHAIKKSGLYENQEKTLLN